MIELPGEQPRGLRRVVGFLRYVGKIVMFSSLLILLPAFLSLYYDLARSGLPLALCLLLYTPLILLLTGCLLFLRDHFSIQSVLVCYLLPLSLLVLFCLRTSVLSFMTEVLILFSAVFVGVGAAMSALLRVEIELKLEEAVLLVALLWILIPVLIAIPVSIILHIHFVDAWFESVEGLTGTGLTVFTGAPDHAGQYVPDVESLPAPIQLWRAIIQWVGGVGIVVSSMAVLSRPGLGTVLLSQIEGRLERIEPSIRKTTVDVLRLYVALTILSVLLYRIAGMSLFDAVVHGMTGIATGGFSTKNGSIGEFHSILIEIVSLPIMILGASNFYDMYKGLRRPRIFLSSPEFKAMIVVAVLASVLGAIALKGITRVPLREALFQAVSAMTNTGFQTIDLASTPPAFKYMLVALMLIGGSIFSTAGGFKVIRMLLLFKVASEEIKMITRPRGSVASYRIGRYNFNKPEVIRGLLIIALFVLTGYIAFMYACFRLGSSMGADNILFDTISALTNTGLSTGVSGASLPLDVKLLFMLVSTLGRLEILPLIVLAYKILRR